MKLKTLFICFLMVFFINVTVWAEQTDTDFVAWKKQLRTQALNEGLTEEFLDEVIPRMTLLPHVVESDKKQPEFQLTFWTYLDKTVTPLRIQKGQEMLRLHHKTLKAAEKKYKVPAKYIVAFWGLESNYGSHKGSIDTLNALTTLAYDTRRRTFFTKELLTFLKILQKEKLSDITGSWAGAFGNFQFMPTTFQAYGVDGDGDGKIDIVNSVPDAIFSAANYLSKMGWNPNVKWGREVKLTKPMSWDDVHNDKQKTLADWEKLGVKPANGGPWPTKMAGVNADILMPMGVDGPVFLTYSNFKVIMRWNRSTLYALAVGLLSDAIEQENMTIYAKRQNNPLSTIEVKEIQEILAKEGYYTSDIDGNVGRGTREALRKYQKDHQLPQDGYASKEILKKMKGIE